MISSNRFQFCMSTEFNIFATVIETACIDLHNISKCSICVIQCCTLLSETSVSISCSCLDKVFALSFWFLSKYNMKKLYHDNVRNHLICHSVSLLTVIKYFRFLWSVWIWKFDTFLNSASYFFKHCMMISISLS